MIDCDSMSEAKCLYYGIRDSSVAKNSPSERHRHSAYVKVDGKKTTLVRGEAWVLRKGQEKEKLEENKLISI
jgi:hypothetical protein